MESKQLASTQFSSLDNATLLTACPSSSTTSLPINSEITQYRSYAGHIMIYEHSHYRHEIIGVKLLYLPLRMSKVRTVPSTHPAIMSVFVTATDVTLSPNVSII